MQLEQLTTDAIFHRNENKTQTEANWLVLKQPILNGWAEFNLRSRKIGQIIVCSAFNS